MVQHAPREWTGRSPGSIRKVRPLALPWYRKRQLFVCDSQCQPVASTARCMTMVSGSYGRGMTPLGTPRASGLGGRRSSGYSRLSSQGPAGSVRSASLAPIDGGLDNKPMTLAGTWWTRWGWVAAATFDVLLGCCSSQCHERLCVVCVLHSAGLHQQWGRATEKQGC